MGVSYIISGVETSGESTISQATWAGITATSFPVGINTSSAAIACGNNSTANTFWHNGTGSNPAVDDKVRSNQAFTIIPANGFYRMTLNGVVLEIRNGIAYALRMCD
jgi:hypothetical protein